MSVSNKQRNVAYGLSDALLNVPSLPIVSERAPTTRDKAPLGTLWVDRPNDDGYILTSIVANSATWIGIGGGSGSFTDLVVSGTIVAGGSITGDGIVSTNSNIVAVAGDIRAIAGDIFTDPGAGDIESGNDIIAAQDITATAGSITATAGNITASAGNITATLGSVSAGTTVTAGTGVTATTGGVTASAGDITATLGDIVADAGDIEAILGAVIAKTVLAAGDLGGTVSTTAFTNVVDNTQGAGALTLVSASANPGTNTGFLKIYVGATVAYVPYFLTIAP